MRAALGASRGRIARELLSETILLAAAAGALGLVLAQAAITLLRSVAPERLPRVEEIGIDPTVLLFTLAISLVTGVLFGLVPAWRAARIDVITALRESGRGAGDGRVKDVVRSALIAIEVALAVVLLVGAGLLIRSAVEMLRVAPGFNPSGVFSARLTLSASKTSAALLAQSAQDIEAAVTALPGVRTTAVSTAVPGFGSFFNGLVPEGESVLVVIDGDGKPGEPCKQPARWARVQMARAAGSR